MGFYESILASAGANRAKTGYFHESFFYKIYKSVLPGSDSRCSCWNFELSLNITSTYFLNLGFKKYVYIHICAESNYCSSFKYLQLWIKLMDKCKVIRMSFPKYLSCDYSRYNGSGASSKYLCNELEFLRSNVIGVASARWL